MIKILWSETHPHTCIADVVTLLVMLFFSSLFYFYTLFTPLKCTHERLNKLPVHFSTHRTNISACHASLLTSLTQNRLV